jgi:magnesium-transporting ATPase (P-type)
MIIEYINKIMRTPTININDIFFGSEQSKYAGIALFMTILILCMIILFSSSRIPIGDRFIFVLFILIISVPSILMSLFELTCIVTGGNSTTRWWCWLLAWVLSVIIIVYCVMIIISMLISMSEYDMANDRLDYAIDKNKMNKEDADIYAKKLIKQLSKIL